MPALLLPGLVAGSVAVVTKRSLVGLFVLAFGLVIWFLLALVVVNEGTLFRLRLQGVLPVLVVSVAGGGLEVYRLAAARIGRWVGAWTRPGGGAPARPRSRGGPGAS